MKVSSRSSAGAESKVTKLNWAKLKDMLIQEKFELELSNRFSAIENEVDTQPKYDFIINQVEEVGEKMLGSVKRGKKSNFISDETKTLISKREQAKLRTKAVKKRHLNGRVFVVKSKKRLNKTKSRR